METNELLYEWIGKQIATHRRNKKWSQTELAATVNLSRGSIANIEKGRQQPPLHVLWDIAEKLEIKMNDIIPVNNEHLPKNDLKKEVITQIEDLKGVKEKNKKILNDIFRRTL